MSRPQQVRIGYQRYALTFTTAQLTKGASADGVTIPSVGVIAIRPDMQEDRKRETLLHEAMHAAWDQTPLRNKESALEEEVISALSPILFALLRDNPTVVRYLLSTS